MLYTGTQRATCTHRMISLVVLIVHLGVDSGLGKARFPHLPSEGREVRQKFYRLSSLSFTNHSQTLFPSAAQVTSSTLRKLFLLWPAWEDNDYACVCVCFSPGPASGTFHPSCCPADVCIERDIKDNTEQEAKKRSIPGCPASPSCWPRAGQPQAPQ